MQVAETFTFELPPDMQQRLNSPAAAGNKAGEHGGKGQDRVKGQDVAARDGDVPTSSKRTKAHAQQQGKPSAAAAAAEVRSVPRPGRRSSSGAADAISGSGKQDEKPKQGKKGQKPQGPGKEQQQQQQQQGATLGQGNEAQALVRAGKNGVGSDAMAAAALRTLSDFARLDTCVTVVDAATFFDNLHSIEELADRYEVACCVPAFLILLSSLSHHRVLLGGVCITSSHVGAHVGPLFPSFQRLIPPCMVLQVRR